MNRLPPALIRASIAVFPLRAHGTSYKGMPWPLNRVHALFQLIYTEEAASHPAPGRNGGRKHRLTAGQVQAARDLRAAGRSVKQIGQLLGNGKPVSRQTVYRALGMLAT
jgi:hypothetical protein